MIAFACTHCGTKLKVKREFAGRQSKCPGCKQPLVVPLPSATPAFVPPQQIDGAESSLAKAGINAGVTLGQHDTSQLPSGGKHLATAPLAGRKSGKERYVIEGEIARGGMGAVLRAIDCDIRREVAVKYMLDAKDPKKQARFVEEAQINGQLEHPNIVPVYDLGIDAQKRPFIMMKMVKGRSLKEVLDQLRDNPKTAEREWSLGRLLNILVNVCNALAFAHSRNVIHRDLKPANIMLGDFGEVYVMDWGLAKVLGHDGQGAAAAVAGPTIDYEPGRHVSTARSSKVVTSREPEADLTQEGSVLGTPVYMPPEQATGNLAAIDQRSDVYSLGAILYEMLTLRPPVITEGGQLGILMQVVQGEIIPPEQRDPKRTKAGKVPKELAAIAMKAMAKEQEGRYPTADALRQDIERFQEGRSVSAKPDTARQMVWKLVKRNKAVSTLTLGFLIVFLWGAWTLFQAWRETKRNFDDYQRAQAAKEEQTKKSIPAFLRAVQMLVSEKKLEDALDQLELALQYDEQNPDLLLLKGQVLIGQLRFAEAKTVLDQYLKLRPQDKATASLAHFCATPQPTVAAQAEMAAILTNQGQGILAAGLYQSNQQQFPIYQKKVEAAWPGYGKRLKLNKDLKLRLDLGLTQVTDLSALRGIPLSELSIKSTNVRDLSPVRAMPLESLDCHGCQAISDLTPLKGMPLTTLSLNGCSQISDLTPLKGMPLTTLYLNDTQVSDLTPLKGMPLTMLHLNNCRQVSDLTPLAGMKLGEVNLPFKVAAGMAVLQKMETLKTINGKPAADFWRAYDAGKFKGQFEP